MAIKRAAKKVAAKRVSSPSRARATTTTSTKTTKSENKNTKSDVKISPVTGKPVRAYTKRVEKTSTVTSKRANPKNIVSEKRPVGRPKKSAVSTSSNGAKGGTKTAQLRDFDDLTGFALGSDQQIIAQELLAGGETRGDIIEKCRKKVDPTTRNGTEKPIANLVSSVFNKLAQKGFMLDSHYQLLPPTPASKRKATRAANAK